MSVRLELYDGVPELSGRVVYESNWYLLLVPDSAYMPLLQLLDPLEMPYKPAARPHVLIAKREAPCRNQADWGGAFVGDVVAVRYVSALQDLKGMHFWIDDCYSPRLCEIREYFGLTTLRRGDGVYLVNFHLTLGRRNQPIEPRPRAQLRLSPRSHADVEIGMQHL